MSRIENPTNPPPRPGQTRRTEDSDTRQDILHHDPEFERRKKDDGQQGFKDAYEDLTDVSVSALRNFLHGLLDRAPDMPVSHPAPVPAPHEDRHPVSPQAAAAAQAYQATARHSAGFVSPPPPIDAVPSSTALDKAAAALDRGLVLSLIRDLDQLEMDGVQAIGLEKGDGFLETIRAAIDRARER